MPELPEVETVRRGLELRLCHSVISHVHVLGNLRDPLDQEELELFCRQRTIVAVHRRAKYLMVIFKEGDGLLMHLGMTGSMAVVPSPATRSQLKHCQVAWDLEGNRTWLFNDIRKFGMLRICRESIADSAPRELEERLGPEPLEDQFNADYLHRITRNHANTIKEFIMDQKNVVGVGNIYASEALFMAGINPRRRAGAISKQALKRLVAAIKDVLKRAIQAGGTTISDFKNLEGTAGGFDRQLLVYGKADDPCPQCGGKIKRCVLGGRSTFYCTKCQH